MNEDFLLIYWKLFVFYHRLNLWTRYFFVFYVNIMCISRFDISLLNLFRQKLPSCHKNAKFRNQKNVPKL